MSVKRLVFSAAASLLFLWFVVPLLSISAAESVVGISTAIVVASFSVSAAGLIAEGCIWLINTRGKMPVLKRDVPPVQAGQETELDVHSVLNDLARRVQKLEGTPETPITTPASSTTAAIAVLAASSAPVQQPPQKPQKQNKNRIDVIMGPKEVVA